MKKIVFFLLAIRQLSIPFSSAFQVQSTVEAESSLYLDEKIVDGTCTNNMTGGRISARDFYQEYHGHPTRDLKLLLSQLRRESDRIIFTAGDSSLDNKYWFHETAPAVSGAYHDLLDPPRMKQDVTYWLNYFLKQESSNEKQPSSNAPPTVARMRTAAINTAVEATTVNERTFRLRPQDVLIRDSLQPQDILIVSVGGNDVALLPLPCTAVSVSSLMCCVPTACIEKGYSYGVTPIDDCCCGCGPSLVSCACSCPPCLGYMRHLFGVRVQSYITALTAKTKPSKILVCMIYYPDERNVPAWAGPALAALGYNTNPSKLQTLIRKGFQEGTSKIHIEGSHVIPVPLFHVLDGKNTDDYVQRVEPSPSGGKKMAEFLLDLIQQEETLSSSLISGTMVATNATTTTSPFTDYMRERS